MTLFGSMAAMIFGCTFRFACLILGDGLLVLLGGNEMLLGVNEKLSKLSACTSKKLLI